jgi:hypothetical protein
MDSLCGPVACPSAASRLATVVTFYLALRVMCVVMITPKKDFFRIQLGDVTFSKLTTAVLKCHDC